MSTTGNRNDSDIESGLSRSSNEGDLESRPLLQTQSAYRMADPERQESDEEAFVEADGSQLADVLERMINGELSEDDQPAANSPAQDAGRRSREQELRRAISSMHLSYSSIESLRILVNVVPFIVLLVFFFILRNGNWFLLFVCITSQLLESQRSMKKEIAKSNEYAWKTVLYCIGNCFMVLSIPFLFFGFRRTIANHLEVPFVLKLSFIDHILFLSVMDQMQQAFFLLLKCLIVLVPLPSSLFGMSTSCKKRQLFAIVEEMSFITRLCVNTPFWLMYYNTISIAFLQSVFSMSYLAFKMRMLMMECIRVGKMIHLLFSSSLMYGESVSLQSLRDRSCSVCMDELTRPIKLSCGHVFCEACIAQWFEKEDTMDCGCTPTAP
ncbi:hypothetical protein WA556_004438 [Blastocystis sp. ATCC 50177/Nand II]